MLKPFVALSLLCLTGAGAAAQQPASRAQSTVAAAEPQLTAAFDTWMKAMHVPGLVYGVVKDGRLVLVRGLGVRDVGAGTAVDADTRFRIASMSKAFTAMAILRLRDAGKLSLDAPAETYVPEMKGWRYPTADSRRITVADLLHHDAGLVEDNPWGDRQQPLSERGFTAMLRAGVPFSRVPGVRMEYSNFGYATLGRIVANLSGRPYQEHIVDTLMRPLGMTSTDYDVMAGDQERRARGYRWQDGAWAHEPDMADGAFGAMGGVETTANDYAKWVAFLLAAWPARDDPDVAPVRRSTVRAIVEGRSFVEPRDRPAALGTPCRQPWAYGMGWFVVNDCDVGRIVTHTGGYPGYGSVVMLLPDAGLGVFAFANRTYGAPSLPVMQTLMTLRRAGLADERAMPVSQELAAAYEAAKLAWRAGDATRAPLAQNVLLDQDAGRRKASIAALKKEVGECRTAAPIAPVSAMEGRFAWDCAQGRVTGRVQRAPTPQLSLQVLDFRRADQ